MQLDLNQLLETWRDRATRLQTQIDQNPRAHQTWVYAVRAEVDAVARCANELDAALRAQR